ncbi:MAG: hypothetical protein RL456_1124 [Pseudomonadota bacterium]|jgi:hypothetical protein
MFATSVLAAMVAAVQAQIDLGGAAVITFYTGTQPPAGGTPTGAVQAQTALASPAGTITGQTLSLTVPIVALRTAGQDITWGRMTRADGSWLMDLTAGLTSSGAHIELDALAGFPGGTVTITGGAIGF